MRVMECACGQPLMAADDKELFEMARNHMNLEHPEKEVSDEQILNLIEAKAYDQDEASQVEGVQKRGLMNALKDRFTDR